MPHKASPADHEKAAAWHLAAADAHDRLGDKESPNRHGAAREKHLEFAYKHLEVAGHPEGVVPENVKAMSAKCVVSAPEFVHHEVDKMLKSDNAGWVGPGPMMFKENSKMDKEDKIPGGLAAGKKPEDFDPKCLAEGVKVEMEHTTDPKIAQEIAMDHLIEDKEYYKKLKTIEKGGYSAGGGGITMSMAPKPDADKRMTLMKDKPKDKMPPQEKKDYVQHIKNLNTIWGPAKPKLTKTGIEFVEKACGGFLRKEKPVTTGGPDDPEEIPLMPHEVRSTKEVKPDALKEKSKLKKAIPDKSAPHEKAASYHMGAAMHHNACAELGNEFDPPISYAKMRTHKDVSDEHVATANKHLRAVGHKEFSLSDPYSAPQHILDEAEDHEARLSDRNSAPKFVAHKYDSLLNKSSLSKAFEDRWLLALSDQMKKASVLHKFPYEFKVVPSGSQRDYLFKVGACEVVYSVMGNETKVKLNKAGTDPRCDAVAKTLFSKIKMAHNTPLIKAGEFPLVGQDKRMAQKEDAKLPKVTPPKKSAKDVRGTLFRSEYTLTPKGEELVKKLYGSNYARTWMEGLAGQDLRREKQRMQRKVGYAKKKPVKNRAAYRLRTQSARLMGFMEEKIGKNMESPVLVKGDGQPGYDLPHELTEKGKEFVKAFGLAPQQAKLKHTSGTSMKGRTNIAARAGKPGIHTPGLVKPKAPSLGKPPSTRPPVIHKAIGAELHVPTNFVAHLDKLTDKFVDEDHQSPEKSVVSHLKSLGHDAKIVGYEGREGDKAPRIRVGQKHYGTDVTLSGWYEYEPENKKSPHVVPESSAVHKAIGASPVKPKAPAVKTPKVSTPKLGKAEKPTHMMWHIYEDVGGGKSKIHGQESASNNVDAVKQFKNKNKHLSSKKLGAWIISSSGHTPKLDKNYDTVPSIGQSTGQGEP